MWTLSNSFEFVLCTPEQKLNTVQYHSALLYIKYHKYQIMSMFIKYMYLQEQYYCK